MPNEAPVTHSELDASVELLRGEFRGEMEKTRAEFRGEMEKTREQMREMHTDVLKKIDAGTEAIAPIGGFFKALSAIRMRDLVIGAALLAAAVSAGLAGGSELLKAYLAGG